MSLHNLKKNLRSHFLPAELMDRLFRGMFWSLLGLVVSKGGMLLAFVFVARMLEKNYFGELGIVQTTAIMFGSFVGYGLGLSATKNIAEFKNTNKEKTGGIIVVNLSSTFIFAFFLALLIYNYSEIIAYKYLNNSDLSDSLKIGSFLVFISAINCSNQGVLSGFEAHKQVAIINLIVGAFSVLFIIIGVHFGEVNGVLIALCLNGLLLTLLYLIVILKLLKNFGINLSCKGCKENLKSLINFSLPATLAGLLVGPVNWISNVILVNSENGYVEMATLSAANQWFSVLIFLPSVIGNVILPILSERFGAGEKRDSNNALFFTLKINLIFIIPIMLFGAFFSEKIMGLYGSEYQDGSLVLIFTLISATLMVVNSPVGQYLTASGKMWTGLILNLFWATAFIMISFLLVGYGALGISIARCIAYFFHLVWQFSFVYFSLIKKA